MLPPLPYLPDTLSGVLLSYRQGHLILGGASRLDAFSVYPFRTWLPSYGFGIQLMHQWSVQPGPLVLRPATLRYPTPAPDRDRTVSRRSEPSSRTALMGEQPIKAVRELGSERREIVRSLSGAGVGYLRVAGLSTRGPGWTDRWCICCSARSMAE